MKYASVARLQEEAESPLHRPANANRAAWEGMDHPPQLHEGPVDFLDAALRAHSEQLEERHLAHSSEEVAQAARDDRP